MDTYGDYAIGLRKEWGIEKKLAPVLYAHKGASLVRNLPELLEDAGGNDVIMNHLIDLLCRLKPYEGTFWRHGRPVGNTRFYDEREWRFVPKEIAKLQFLVDAAATDKAARDKANADVAEQKLTFDLTDIRYVIVRSESEILPTIHELERTQPNEYSQDQLRLMISRIICAEHIREDF